MVSALGLVICQSNDSALATTSLSNARPVAFARSVEESSAADSCVSV
jgi:hypothetical protein